MRCDGLVVATPQGSTGYNLANGGPVMAWGVEGYVVSFVAPHSLTARALVIAPGDLLTINNASREEPVEVHVDGRPSCELPPGEDLHVEFGASHGTLAQLPGASFYHRLARALRKTRALNCNKSARNRAGFRPRPADRPCGVLHELRVENLLLIERAELGLGPGLERPDRRDRGGQDRARPRARPAAGRQAAVGHRPAGRVGGVRRGRVRAARGAARGAGGPPARGRGRAGARPARERRGPHARVRRRPQRHGGRSAGARRRAAVVLRPARAPAADAGVGAARDPRRLLRAGAGGTPRGVRGRLRARARAARGAGGAARPRRRARPRAGPAGLGARGDRPRAARRGRGGVAAGRARAPAPRLGAARRRGRRRGRAGRGGRRRRRWRPPRGRSRASAASTRRSTRWPTARRRWPSRRTTWRASCAATARRSTRRRAGSTRSRSASRCSTG